jgi:pyruvate kinase
VAKIEKTEAVADLDNILEVTDAVMVARGDLGVEAEISRVPILQKQIIRRCNELTNSRHHSHADAGQHADQ